MTREEAADIMKAYPCVCPYGTSPYTCQDNVCKFGEAIRTLTREGYWASIPRRQGEPPQWTCTACNNINDFAKTKYCYFCGAKMKKEADDDTASDKV